LITAVCADDAAGAGDGEPVAPDATRRTDEIVVATTAPTRRPPRPQRAFARCSVLTFDPARIVLLSLIDFDT
jgi:hypothetical protein